MEATNVTSPVGEEYVRAQLVRHFGFIARSVSELPSELMPFLQLCDRILVHLEVAGLIAAQVYKVAVAQNPDFDPLFVQPQDLRDWKSKLLDRCDAIVSSSKEDGPDLRQRIEKTCDRMAEMALPPWEAYWQRLDHRKGSDAID